MALIRATRVLVLYNPQTKIVVAEVYPGNRYSPGAGVLVYEGNVESFLIENPEYGFYGQ